jgi:hypothetical protein
MTSNALADLDSPGSRSRSDQRYRTNQFDVPQVCILGGINVSSHYHFRYLTLKFGPQINVIIGQNGSELESKFINLQF